jgi:hypothetical protein
VRSSRVRILRTLARESESVDRECDICEIWELRDERERGREGEVGREGVEREVRRDRAVERFVRRALSAFRRCCTSEVTVEWTQVELVRGAGEREKGTK